MTTKLPTVLSYLRMHIRLRDCSVPCVCQKTREVPAAQQTMGGTLSERYVLTQRSGRSVAKFL
jgi:hypothetical protein